MSDIKALFEYDDVVNEVENSGSAKALKVSKGEIEFRNVGFRYENGKQIFNGLNFGITSGESVAIVGPSGEGKTSLMRLLFRIYDVNEGAIIVDGKDVRNVKQQSLRG